jgi:pilus assembly protein CpaB
VKRRVLTVIVAVLLALLGTVGVLAYVHQADARAVAGQKAVSVLVADQIIPAGTLAGDAVRNGMLVPQTMPASSVPADAVTSVTADLSRLVTSASLQAGQLLLRPMLVTSAQAAGAGALAIPNGMVAVTIQVCMPAAVAGYVRPGSSVAVFDTFSTTKLNMQVSCNGSSSQQQPEINSIHTRVVLPKVLVLSVGPAPASGSTTATGLGSSGSSSSASTSGQVMVTMAASQADAERLIVLTETGLPYLALLSPSSQVGFDTVLPPLFRP